CFAPGLLPLASPVRLRSAAVSNCADRFSRPTTLAGRSSRRRFHMASTPTWQPPKPDQRGWNIERHILEGQLAVKGATGELSGLLQQITLCTKIIASRVNMAGLADNLGLTGETNVQGEEVQKL